MMKKGLLKGTLIAAVVVAMPLSVSAMPGDIEEAVTEDGYDAYSVQNDYTYDDSDLIAIGENYVATAQAMIRTAPFGDIIDSTVPGQTYYVTGECSDCMWYKVTANGEEGYVYSMYLVPESDYNQDTGSNSETSYNVRTLDLEVTVTGASSLNVRSYPGTNGSVIGTVKKGDDIHVTGNVLTKNWYQVEYNGQTGYICDDYVTPDFPETMACQASALNIRSAASNSASVIGTMKYGDKVRVSEMDGDWYKFMLDDGSIGYVYDEYLSVVQ